MAKINFDELRELVLFMKEQDLQEIWIERKDYKVGLVKKREQSAARRRDDAYASPASLSGEEEAGDVSVSMPSITAPLVGIFRRSRNPSSPPLVNVGDVIETGQMVGYIEAMKMLNEVKSSSSGKVNTVLVEDGHPVEFGQALFLLEEE